MQLGAVWCAVAICVSTAHPAGAQTASADSTSVAQAHEAWFRGLRTADTTTLSGVLADDVSLGFATGMTLPRAALMRALQAGQVRYESVEPETQRMRVYGAVAVVTGRATLAVRAGPTLTVEHVTYTATYRRGPSMWRMIAWQSTLIAPPPAPARGD